MQHNYTQAIRIGQTMVGPEYAPFIIAEMSGNHNGSLERALEIVAAAAAAGAHAVKLQTYTADTMTVRGAYRIDDPNSLWHGRELYELYQEAYTPWDWHAPIFERARALNMEVFSSPFDESAVDFLEELGAPAYKIASFENTDWPLLQRVASTGKPVILSTGASTLADIDEAVRVLRSHGCRELIVLKCTSTYPATPENTNLATIPHMRQMLDCQVGLSDHTMGVGVAVTAVALGATVVEKHFTLRRADGGVDSAFSMEPQELKLLVEESERAWLALGQVKYGVQKAEKNSLLFKRSLYVVKDIAAGDPFTRENVRAIRPGNGLPTKFLEQLLDHVSNADLKAGTPLSWNNIMAS